MNGNMAEIHHHLTDALLLGYSSGSLPEAFSLVVATHISYCDGCRARLGAFDAVGGSVLANTDAAPMDAASLDTALAAIRNGEETSRTIESQVADDAMPAPLSDYIGPLASVRWRRIGGGVSQAMVPTGGAATARLLRIPAGTAVPDHGHSGTELTLVLQGAFHDGHARFGPGDIEVADADMHHRPVADTGAVCICLAATDAPLRFSGIIPRIAQRVLRI